MTLFELAVVVAITIILAGLAVYSTQSIIVRTKVSRVREEHRVLVRALQNYSMDYSELPSAEQGLDTLTRPTAYLGELPHDPFQKSGHGYVYLLPNTPGMGCVLISPGPDGDFDLPMELYEFISMEGVDQRLMPMQVATIRRASRAGAGGGSAAGPVQIKKMSDSQFAILTTYIKLGQYDPDKGEDGDIITVLR